MRGRSRRPWAGSRKRASTPASTLPFATSARGVRHRRLLPFDLHEDGVSRIHQAAGGLAYQRVLGALAPQHPARPVVGLARASDRGAGIGREIRSTGGAAARQVVRGELDPNPVADQDPDVELAHLPRGIRQDRLAGLELDLEHRIRQRLDHLGVHLDRLFFAGRGLLDLKRVDAGPQRGGTAAFLRIATFLAQTVDILPELPVRESGACRSRPSWRATYGRSWSAKGSRSEPTRP